LGIDSFIKKRLYQKHHYRFILSLPNGDSLNSERSEESILSVL